MVRTTITGQNISSFEIVDSTLELLRRVRLWAGKAVEQGEEEQVILLELKKIEKTKDPTRNWLHIAAVALAAAQDASLEKQPNHVDEAILTALFNKVKL